MSEAIRPFEIHVDQVVLDDLWARLERTRYPDHLEGVGWDYGMPVDYLRTLVDFWLGDYDWRAQEARLNERSHFQTTIDGQSIHFIHERSPNDNALPLVITHGWPGSVVEFLQVIPRLTRPDEHGGRPEDAFHVVAPSLPGYAFSEPPRTPGWDVRRIARAWTALMERLGYTRYGTQGGDWGAQVATRMAAYDPEHCVGLHLNMPVGTPPDDPVPLTEQDQADLADMAKFQRLESGYANEQGTKPQTIGISLTDSPAGLLAWIVEKFRTWSDCDGDLETIYTKDQLITNVMLYWVTGTGASAARLYRETMQGGALGEPLGYIDVPTGVGRYPKEILRHPRPWVEQRHRVTHWVDMPRGGHFAAMEQPDLFVEDLRNFFRTVR